ncbi:MAG: DNA repair protein RecN [Paracoccaceae bacterium]|jgi:DNA repair protein RecN (Recombination protein N)|nr:DNA repair protein RecN [Paracoccaceae bacterium]
MLRGLDIRDMLLIDRLELELRPGLNVLTGETGAGKSILLDCLGFVLGWRGRAELVRPGAAQGEVTAVFELGAGHPARGVLEEAGLPVRDELILRRVNSAEGRKTAWVNDRRASGEVLRALSESLVELHGQHDDRGLLNARGHRALLDAFAGVAAERATVRAAWGARREAAAALEAAQARIAALAAEEEFLRHAVAEIETLAPEEGEHARLEERRRLLKAARGLGETVAAAQAAIGEEAAGRLLRDALRGLEGAADRAEGALDAALDALAAAADALSEAEREVDAAAERLAFDPRELERVEDRFHAYRDLARKHHVAEDGLAALGGRLRAGLDALEAGAADLGALEAALAEAEARYEAAAAELGARRRAAAAALDAAMADELAPLKMERAVFSTAIEPGEPGPEGREAVEFRVTTNPGAPPGPLARIASGGELSRFLLALKVCLRGDDAARTLIFDEIDRGVGGATAAAVGKRLARLAEGGQVLVVTHSPQVAARGGHHWRVEKRVTGEQTLSTVAALDTAARIDEVARMLAGDTVTDEARAAARALLEG